MFKDMIWVTLGAIVGANLRYAISRFSQQYISASVPVGTLFINITGSFILGFFLIWVTERVVADPRLRPLIAVGFCGTYTTFSSYAFETFSLFEQGHMSLAAGNFLTNNVLSLAAVVAGAVLARAL